MLHRTSQQPSGLHRRFQAEYASMVEGAAVPSEEDIKAVREEMKAEKKKNRRGGSRRGGSRRGGRGERRDRQRIRYNSNNNINNNSNSNTNTNTNWSTNAQYEEFP